MITIIIPTYNSEKTIANCLDSVLAQSFEDYECLIVDYPDTDNTEAIVAKYKSYSKKIKYIKSAYKGATAQRQLGIENAEGDYICFVDSDDIIHKDYVKILFTNLLKYNTDLSVCNIARCDFTSAKANKNKPNINNIIVKNKQYKKYLSNYRYYIGSPTPVGIIAKKSLFIKAVSYYNRDANICYWEDAILSYYLFFNSTSVVFSKGDPLYYYLYNNESTTNIISDYKKYFNDCIRVSVLLSSIISSSKYKRFYKQSNIYAVFGFITYLLNSKNSFNAAEKYFSLHIKKRGVRIFEKEYTLSESLFAFSIKYNIPILANKLIKRLNNKKIK